MIKTIALQFLALFAVGLTIAILTSYASVTVPFEDADVSEVVFVVDGQEMVATVCDHCFDLAGVGGGSFEMPERFLTAFEGYRDSLQDAETWPRR